VFAIVSAHEARAQQATSSWGGPVPGPPVVTGVFGNGDANGTAGSFGVPSFVFAPLRLSLYGDAPEIGHADPACTQVESAGMQHATAMRLVPRLVLTGFSRSSCALDAGVGGGLVYATPIAPKVWLVAAAGILHLPHYDAGKPVTKYQLRGDVVFDRGGGRSISVGIGQHHGSPMVSVGGVL
jgi:hypothetical protein